MQFFFSGAYRDRTGDLRLAKLYSALWAEAGKSGDYRREQVSSCRLAEICGCVRPFRRPRAGCARDESVVLDANTQLREAVVDQADELAHPCQEWTPVRLVPDQVDVGREGVEIHDDVHRTRPDDLIGEIDVVRGLRESGLVGSRRHAPFGSRVLAPVRSCKSGQMRRGWDRAMRGSVGIRDGLGVRAKISGMTVNALDQSPGARTGRRRGSG
jgi:hypothetical protein